MSALPKPVLLVAPVLWVAGCSPLQGAAWWVGEPGADGVKPVIEVLSPAPGTTYAVGETLEARATISHPLQPVDELIVTLSQEGEVVEGWSLSEEGSWSWEAEVLGGLAAAELRVEDSDGDVATATLSWSGNRPPEVGIEAPEADARFFAGEPVATRATLTDPDVSDPRLLDARWEIGGSTVAEGAPDAEGTVELSLPAQEAGTYELVFVGSDGVLEASAAVTVRVDPPPDTGDTGSLGGDDTGS